MASRTTTAWPTLPDSSSWTLAARTLMLYKGVIVRVGGGEMQVVIWLMVVDYLSWVLFGFGSRVMSTLHT